VLACGQRLGHGLGSETQTWIQRERKKEGLAAEGWIVSQGERKERGHGEVA